MLQNKGWEILITRLYQQYRRGRKRTVGTYQIFHDGKRTNLWGMTAESPGPGDNSKPGNHRCVEAKTYPLNTHAGEHYVTYGYTDGGPSDFPKPAVELSNTGRRKAILIHPGHDFLASIGCINLTSALPYDEDIAWEDSRERVIDMIEDMKKYLGHKFPDKNGKLIPGASVVIEELKS